MPTVASVALILLAAPASAALLRTHAPLIRRATAAPTSSRCRALVALFEDDPWLQSAQSKPFSTESLDVLFRYGPETYWARQVDPGEYNASVRKIMQRYPRISRALAEQEINLFLSDATGYMAKQTKERKRKGPSESELKPPVGIFDKLLVLAWVAILTPASAFLIKLCLALNDSPAKETQRMIEAAGSL